MILAGLTLAKLAAVFGAVGAATIALYMLKLRRRSVAVVFSPLWERILRDKEATSLFSKLKRILSLLLQLALLALLVLALGDPRAAATLMKGRSVVVLLDASASMQATDVAPNRLSAAKDEVKTMIRGLGGADRMLVAQMDAMVTPLGPMSGDTSELERELEGVRATDARADFPRALRFAADTLRGADNPEIIVVSDGGLGEPADATHLRLQAGERLPRFYPNLSGASEKLEAALAFVDGSHDELPADDHAYALLPERRRAKLLLVTEGNTYLEAALLLDEYLDVTQVKPSEY